jgi:potassium efflux system protein
MSARNNFGALALLTGVMLLPMNLALAQETVPSDISQPNAAQTDDVQPNTAPNDTAPSNIAPRIGQADSSGALVPRQVSLTPLSAIQNGVAEQATAASLDYDAWDKMALRVERTIEDRRATDTALEKLRGQLVEWRAALQGAQNANSARIITLRAQIAAFGPPPAGGDSEPEDLAKRRAELTQQLVRLQAPTIAADEAYRRADGLIREIDRTVRERQADQLLQVWPVPINPANWPEALIGLTDTGVRIWDEITENWADKDHRAALFTNLPFVIIFLVIGFGLAITGRRWAQNLATRLREKGQIGAQRIVALLASLGEMLFSIIGVILVASTLVLSEMLGELGTRIVEDLAEYVWPLIIAAWMAGRIFPRGNLSGPLELGREGRDEGRVLSVLMGLILGLDQLRLSAMAAQDYSEATTSVVSFPILVIAGLLLLRMGQMLARQLSSAHHQDGDSQNFGRSSLMLIARAATLLGIAAPILAAVGYVAAASALIYPAIYSLGLIGVLLILQHLVGDVYAMINRTEVDKDDSLIPVLASFALSVASLPIFALIWGARVADITELWTRFREGFQFGETRISPTDFLFLAVVFAIGYGLTRLLQGALKSTILPRTGLDQGAQNATVSGVGYVGIILAALIAINTAGIDLSGLAIVAGALSVGIGFGLQNIVSNFVSGVILLIERPVSEGDWIEVGTTSGIVKSISVRSTRIQTFDRADVIVPNTDLVAGRVTNWTRYNLTGRLTVPITVPNGTDSRRVEVILREIAEGQPLALMNPAPVVALVSIGTEVMTFEMRVILRDINAQVAVRSEILHQITARFAAEGFAFSRLHAEAQAHQTALEKPEQTPKPARPSRAKTSPTTAKGQL